MSSIPLWELILPPLLLFIALRLYDHYHPPSSSPSSPTSRKSLAHHAHIFHNQTTHTRFLPHQSSHTFTYPLLQLGLDLDSLDSGHLDLPFLFRYVQGHRPQCPSRCRCDVWWNPWSWSFRICSIRPKQHLSPHNDHHASFPTTEDTFKNRLLSELKSRSIDTTCIGSCYMVTMPSCLGYETINPLSVYFCYNDQLHGSRQDCKSTSNFLAVVVLEVHNTFGERHLYVLIPNQQEDQFVLSGFDHQWTISRKFHVSPFNDCQGKYRISLSNPFPGKASSDNDDDGHIYTLQPPKLNIRIEMLTPSGEKKFQATLTGHAKPFSSLTLLTSLISQPLAFFITLPRILYEAAKLHYGKPKLDVFARPEPDEVDTIGRQPSDWSARVAKSTILQFLRYRVDELAKEACKEVSRVEAMMQQMNEQCGEASEDQLRGSTVKLAERNKLITVTIQSHHPDEPNLSFRPNSTLFSTNQKQILESLQVEELVITIRSARFYIDVLMAPTPSLAYLLESTKMTSSPDQRTWKVSSPILFHRVFLKELSICAQQSGCGSIQAHLLKKLRERQFSWAMSFVEKGESEDHRAELNQMINWSVTQRYRIPHDLDNAYLKPVHPRLNCLHNFNNDNDNNENDNETPPSWSLVLAILWNVILDRLTYYVFDRVAKVRFVQGSQPWLAWSRIVNSPLNLQKVDEQVEVFGSVSNETGRSSS